MRFPKLRITTMDFVQQALWLALIPLALIGLVGVADVAFFKGVIGVRLAVFFNRG